MSQYFLIPPHPLELVPFFFNGQTLDKWPTKILSIVSQIMSVKCLNEFFDSKTTWHKQKRVVVPPKDGETVIFARIASKITKS